MANNFDKNWTTVNNNYPLNDKEVERYISVKPSANQLALVDKPFYTFMHFGMNTATDREWGAGVEKATDFTIKSINAKQWVETAKSAGATGVILTCKHHDGFCLWPSEYTSFCVKNSSYKGDIVKEVSDECHKQGMDFGVYLSPWDMHDERYGTDAYNDYFCNQLTELLTNYGEIFEVWFDGAKGSNAKKFEYDWQRYYDLIRKLQPKANIAICGPDIRWVGNEGGKSRKSEYSVVPCALREADRIMALSQQDENQASSLQKYNQMDEDLGSRKILEKMLISVGFLPRLTYQSVRVGSSTKRITETQKVLKSFLKSILIQLVITAHSFLIFRRLHRAKYIKRTLKILKSSAQ